MNEIYIFHLYFLVNYGRNYHSPLDVATIGIMTQNTGAIGINAIFTGTPATSTHVFFLAEPFSAHQ